MVTHTTATSLQPAPSMTSFSRTVRDYVLWSYERGTIQYDVMVTLILLFIFVSPYWINFKDKPRQHDPHRTEVVVAADGGRGLVFDIDGSAFQKEDDPQLKADLLQVIQPIAGDVTITKYERNADGHAVNYRVWVTKISVTKISVSNISGSRISPAKVSAGKISVPKPSAGAP